MKIRFSPREQRALHRADARGPFRAPLILIAVSVALAVGPASTHGQENWTPRASGTTEMLQGVAYGAGVFVAVGAAGVVLRSTDHGQTWQNRSNEEVTTAGLRSVAFGDGRFMAIAADDVIVSSDLGLTWKRATVPDGWWSAVTFGTGGWFLAGETGIVSSSNHGQSWIPVYQGQPALTDILARGDTMVAVGGSIYTSTNQGRTWTDTGIAGADWLECIAYGANQYLAAGGLFGDILFRTSDPTKWSDAGRELLPNAPGPRSIRFGNDVFVAVCREGRILVSSGSGPWRSHASGTNHDLLHVEWGNGTFVAVGEEGSLLTSGSPRVASRISNVSVRTTLTANQVLIVGITMSGGAKPVLVRACGPALQAFGVTGTMPDPRVSLFRDATLLEANDNWGGGAVLSTAFASVGAFPFTPASLDAALLSQVDGGRTAQVSGPSPGNVLVEAYDAAGGVTPRLTNVSARNRVGAGSDILIAGFTVEGTEPKSLLIRAIGPTLSAFGVAGVLSDPKLEIYSGQTKVAENDSWAASLATTFAGLGAFGLPAASRDAAILLSLSPGGYTVHVRGADGGTGEALVEIYDTQP
jgi:hypothetical protein